MEFLRFDSASSEQRALDAFVIFHAQMIVIVIL